MLILREVVDKIFVLWEKEGRGLKRHGYIRLYFDPMVLVGIGGSVYPYRIGLFL
jgi:hypothetical protein